MKFIFYSFIFIFILSCSFNKVVNHHGVHFLEKKYEKLTINKTNKNDIIKILGEPSTKSSFDNDVIKSKLPVLVDFWAEWCGPCKMIAPTLEELAEEYSESLVIAKLDVDNNPQTASSY